MHKINNNAQKASQLNLILNYSIETSQILRLHPIKSLTSRYQLGFFRILHYKNTN